MQTDLYVTVSSDREHLALLEVLRRLPYALDTRGRTMARTCAAAVGYRIRQTGAPVRRFSELDPEKL